MTAERFEIIEQRTRKVEEAVIRFEHIANTILVKLDDRVCHLEEEMNVVNQALYQSCDAKTKEIDSKIADAVKVVSESTEKLFKQAIGISIGMFTMFTGAVVYMNSEHGRIYEKINNVNERVVEDKTHISSIHYTLEKIDDKLDKLRGDK